MKVKEPLPEEYGRLRDDLCLFTYLHLAADERLTRALVDSGATCIAYETVQTPDGRLPLLAPMSEVAGRLATQMGAWALEKAHGGRGILLGGVPGVPPARVLVLGGGIVGFNAAVIAVGMQADVWVLDRSIERMRELEVALGGRITLAMSSRLQIEELLPDADLVMVGENKHAYDVEALRQMPGVHYREYTHEILAFYRASDVFLLPSHTEGMSNALLEAMACGLPSVATRVGAAEVMVAEGESGLLVDAGDVDGMAQALAALVGDAAARTRMGAAAALRVRAYGIGAVVDRLEAAYRELLAVPR